MELGANVIEAPTIELHPPGSWREVDQVLGIAEFHAPRSDEDLGLRTESKAEASHSVLSVESNAGHSVLSPGSSSLSAAWDWVIFTSANGVRFTRDRLRALGRDVRVFGNAKIAAIGDVTADAIRNDLSLHVDLCPESFVAEALASALAERGQIAGKRFLLLRADIARPILREKLEQAHAAEVRDVSIYETRPASSLPQNLLDALDAKSVHWITFTSSSTAKNFAMLLGSDYREKLKGVKIASIGPITTATLRELGLEPDVQAETFNVGGLVAAIGGSVNT
jgi:uroporphyrinogen III methyltransferase/synthase